MSMATANFAENQVIADAQRLLRGATAWTAALLGDTLGSRPASEFGILMYHRIADPVKGHPTPTWNVTPRRFEQQLAGLLKRGFQAWPLRKVLEYRRRQLPLPRRVFVVTFDDGYENNFTNAFAILRRLNVPATIFLATAYLDSPDPLPFDDWSARGVSAVPSDTWRALSTEQCREMQASGIIELAGHTHTHQDFRNRPEEFRDDLRQCRAQLAEKFGLDDATFAFPYGTRKLGFSGPAMSRIVREVGFLCSLTTEEELCRVETSPFDWGRLTADQRDTAATLAGKLTGWYSMLRQGLRAIKQVATRSSASSNATPAVRPKPFSNTIKPAG